MMMMMMMTKTSLWSMVKLIFEGADYLCMLFVAEGILSLLSPHLACAVLLRREVVVWREAGERLLSVTRIMSRATDCEA